MVSVLKILSDSNRGIQVKGRNDYIKLSRKGLSMRQMKEILAFTGIPMKEMSALISISNRQLARYTDEKIFKTDISAHLIQIVELYKFGYEVFEEKEKFQRWMKSDIRALDYEKPISLLDTPFGIDAIKTILGRLEHSVYS